MFPFKINYVGETATNGIYEHVSAAALLLGSSFPRLPVTVKGQGGHKVIIPWVRPYNLHVHCTSFFPPHVDPNNLFFFVEMCKKILIFEYQVTLP